jgi:BTB/POZ domain-containing protein KCTD9
MTNRLLNLSNRAVLGILIAVALASSGLSLIINIVNNVDTSPAWLVSWLQNFSTEMFGAFLTYILLELVVGGRQQREAELKAEGQHKQRLIIQMGSQDNGIALQGLKELKAHGWVKVGSLQGADLRRANLQGANLREANLQDANLFNSNLEGANLSEANVQDANLWNVNLHKANLREANLHKANLWQANLDRANLRGTNLQDSNLWSVNLQGADLTLAKLQGADLGWAKLQGANLKYANLQGADLRFAKFDEATILPDETHWTPDTDMTKFTQPDNEAGSLPNK